MLSWIRVKFGPVMIGIIIGFIAFVFVFYGVFNPRSTRGLHEGAVAGTVNGENISISEFSRELNRRLEFFKQMGGNGLTEAQLKSLRIRDAVFNDMVNRKLMMQEALKMGFVPSDEEIRDRIREIPAFQREGHFDATAYKQILMANNFTPATFEKSVREDLATQKLNAFFRNRLMVSDEEIRQEFLAGGDKRNIKYVSIPIEEGRKGIQVSGEEIKKFLADSTKKNIVKTQYDAEKTTRYKGKKYEEVETEIARNILAGDHPAEVRKFVDHLVDQVATILSADKKSDAKINTMLKPYGAQVRTSGLITRQNRSLIGLGEATDVMNDAFGAGLTHPKKYSSAGYVSVALVIESEKPDLTKLGQTGEEKNRLRSQIAYRKEKSFMDSWMKTLSDKAKVEKNAAVVSDEGAAEGGA
jgi:parvulin-like peptidyl-prolyl isomerase